MTDGDEEEDDDDDDDLSQDDGIDSSHEAHARAKARSKRIIKVQKQNCFNQRRHAYSLDLFQRTKSSGRAMKVTHNDVGLVRAPARPKAKLAKPVLKPPTNLLSKFGGSMLSTSMGDLEMTEMMEHDEEKGGLEDVISAVSEDRKRQSTIRLDDAENAPPIAIAVPYLIKLAITFHKSAIAALATLSICFCATNSILVRLGMVLRLTEWSLTCGKWHKLLELTHNL